MIAPGRHDASKTMSIPTAPKAKAAPFLNETAEGRDRAERGRDGGFTGLSRAGGCHWYWGGKRRRGVRCFFKFKALRMLQRCCGNSVVAESSRLLVNYNYAALCKTIEISLKSFFLEAAY